ncbi:hypothetical protein MKW98_006172, partial [Papaver atlanticum]
CRSFNNWISHDKKLHACALVDMIRRSRSVCWMSSLPRQSNSNYYQQIHEDSMKVSRRTHVIHLHTRTCVEEKVQADNVVMAFF